MSNLKITLVSGAVLEHTMSEVEVLESKTESIAKGKCFVRILENDHHYEISKRICTPFRGYRYDKFCQGADVKNFYWDKLDEEIQKQKEQDTMPALDSEKICEPVWLQDRATDHHTGEDWPSQYLQQWQAFPYTPI